MQPINSSASIVMNRQQTQSMSIHGESFGEGLRITKGVNAKTKN